MTTSTSLPARPSGKLLSKNALFICGILSSLLYLAMNIFVPLQYPGYNSASQTVSELSAIGVPSRPLWVILGTIYTLLVVAFGWGVWNSTTDNSKIRTIGILLIIYGLLGIGWPLAPMHQREVIATGGGTISDTLHIVFSIVTSMLMLMAMGFGAMGFGRKFRFYSILTIQVLIIFGAMTALQAPQLQANVPTPLLGVWERIMIGVFLLWVIVLAVELMRSEKQQNESPAKSVKEIRSDKRRKSMIALPR